MKIAIFDSGWEYSVNTPYEKPLGGTQSAICYFLEEMAIRGHQTYLFNKFDLLNPSDVKTFNKMKHFYKMDIKEMPESIENYL